MERSAEQVRENYKRITDRIGEAMAKYRKPEEQVQLMAVTKTVDPALVNVAVECGVRLLGENRVQEYESKKAQYDPRAQVQFIGQLQTNKVKYLIPEISMIQSVDSLHLANEVERIAARADKVQDILLEVNIGGEAAKSGFAPQEVENAAAQAKEMGHVRVRGLMTIPPADATREENVVYFQKVQALYVDINRKMYDNELEYLSMGMSGDFADAIRAGANMVRVGTAIFGARDYSK